MTSYGRYDSIPGMLAGANLSTKQYYAVKFASTVGEVVVASGVNDKIAGLLQNDPADGEVADVAFCGIAKGICESTAIVFGDAVSTNTTAELQIAAKDSVVLGYALETSSAVGDIISIMLDRGWRSTSD